MKPWQVKSWVIPKAGADFVCAMEDVLKVYERPYNERNPVICFDESPRRLIGEKRRPYVDKQGSYIPITNISGTGRQICL